MNSPSNLLFIKLTLIIQESLRSRGNTRNCGYLYPPLIIFADRLSLSSMSLNDYDTSDVRKEEEMRKFSTILSMLVLALMLLSACAGSVSNTNVPATSPIETDVISTPSVESTTTVSETTTPAEAAATETESATAVVPVTGNPNTARLSEQLNFTVLNQTGQQLGQVEDMILNLDNAMVAYVTVNTGDKQIVVPWDKLSMQSDQPSAFILQVDDDTFTKAPAVDLNTLPAIGEPANDWDAQLRSYWKDTGGAQPATGSSNQGKLRGLMLASQALAADMSVQGQTALQAEIQDLIVNTKSGKIQFVVVKTSLDSAERWIPVPLALINWDTASQAFNMDLDISVLQAALPAVAAQFPDTTVEGWEQEWIDFWQSQGVTVTP